MLDVANPAGHLARGVRFVKVFQEVSLAGKIDPQRIDGCSSESTEALRYLRSPYPADNVRNVGVSLPTQGMHWVVGGRAPSGFRKVFP